jgi:beta-lactamase class A
MQLPRRVLTAVTMLLMFAFVSPASAAPMPGPMGELQLQLATMSLRAPGHVGVVVEDLTTGYTTSVNGGAVMPAASVIKIPVMVEVFRRLSIGDFDLNRHVTLLASDRDWGWGELADARIGTRYTVGRLLTLMITDSDNTATNMLIRLVGRSAINREMRALGLQHTWLGNDIRSEGPIRSELRSTAHDMIVLLSAMAHNRLIDEWSSREMLDILSGQRHNTLLPVPLPPGTTIAHKTGSLSDTLNDVGIVFLEDAPYAIAVLTTNLPSLDAGRRFIRTISRVAYDEVARFGAWREVNLPGLSLALPRPFAFKPSAPRSPDLKMWSPPSGPPPAASPADVLPAPLRTPEPFVTTE